MGPTVHPLCVATLPAQLPSNAWMVSSTPQTDSPDEFTQEDLLFLNLQNGNSNTYVIWSS